MKHLITFILLFSFLIPIYTQDVSDDGYSTYKADKKRKRRESSPYEFGIKKELPFLIVGAGLTTTGLILRGTNNTPTFTIDEVNSLDRNDVNSFDRKATYNWDEQALQASDILLVSSIFIPTLLLVNKNPRADFGPLLIMGLEVAMVNYGLTSMTKNIFNRTRPYPYNPELSYDQRSDSQSRLSFFSGHTSATASFSFYVAKVINDYSPNMKLGWKITMWTAAAAIPATTAYLRFEAGMHFPTDVIAGYIIGAATGWAIPHLHKKKDKPVKLSIYPTRVFGTSGIGLTYKL